MRCLRVGTLLDVMRAKVRSTMIFVPKAQRALQQPVIVSNVRNICAFFDEFL